MRTSKVLERKGLIHGVCRDLDSARGCRFDHCHTCHLEAKHSSVKRGPDETDDQQGSVDVQLKSGFVDAPPDAQPMGGSVDSLLDTLLDALPIRHSAFGSGTWPVGL